MRKARRKQSNMVDMTTNDDPIPETTATKPGEKQQHKKDEDEEEEDVRAGSLHR